MDMKESFVLGVVLGTKNDGVYVGLVIVEGEVPKKPLTFSLSSLHNLNSHSDTVTFGAIFILQCFGGNMDDF